MNIISNNTQGFQFPKIFTDLIDNKNPVVGYTCLHKACTKCSGTGFDKVNKSACFHFISCPCSNCTPYC